MITKVKLAFLLVAFVLSVSVAPQPAAPFYGGVAIGSGVYLGNGAFVCHSEKNCLHELGHAVSEWSGYLSEGEEFRLAVDEFVSVSPFWCRFPGVNGNHFSTKLTGVDWGGYEEFYASYYACVLSGRCEMEYLLKPFYSGAANAD
ncbi:MAG: hypothetical protein JRD89_14530 [Deltaproteobacteria bacterium]|nr:hypothetical protein [Deltaproteobacteria bacterium]